MKGKSLAADGLRESHLQAFVRGRRRSDPRFSRGWMESVVKSLVESGAIRPPCPLPLAPAAPVDRALEPYAEYLRRERSLKWGPGQYLAAVRRFLVHRFGSHTPRPDRLTAQDLTEFVLRESRRYSVGGAKHTVSALRSYVRFLQVCGGTDRDLTGAIPAISGWRLVGIPQGIAPEHLRRILADPDRRTGIGRRDFAILLLLAHLGLRRHEVASLVLEDIDWQRGELRIRGKGDKHERLPLPQAAGAALADYLRKRGRSHQHARALFLGVRTPFRPLTPGGVSGVVFHRSLQSGTPIWAHRLRHTVATQILRQGGSLDEVAQLLRHSSHDTTAIYAKVDLAALRAVARPWPCSGRSS
jgi:site-specific recombinase XerD